MKMKFKIKFKKENIKAAVATGVVLLLLWFGGGAFIDLVKNIYHFLDGFLWAFFAGVIAFFLAIWFMVMSFYITLFCIGFLLWIFIILYEWFEKYAKKE